MSDRRAIPWVIFMTLTTVVGCGGPRPDPGSAPAGDAELAQLVASGRLAFDRGDADLAHGFYQRALQRARAMDDPAAIADAAYNLGACHLRLGEPGNARLALSESLAEAKRSAARTADIQLLLARAAALSGDSAQANAAIDAIRAADSGASATERAAACLLRGAMRLDEGRPGDARAELSEARSRAQLPIALEAGAVALEARLATAEGRARDAALLHDREAELHRRSRNFGEVPLAHSRAADAYLGAGDRAAAALRFYWAGRSAVSQRRAEEGHAWLDRAMRLAAELDDRELLDRTALLSRPSSSPATQPVLLSPGPAGN